MCDGTDETEAPDRAYGARAEPGLPREPSLDPACLANRARTSWLRLVSVKLRDGTGEIGLESCAPGAGMSVGPALPP
jgi:hypothetical protein